MSKVFSFRLNPKNQREAEALAILKDWLAQGYSIRHTVTEALLNLNAVNSQTSEKHAIDFPKV